MATITQLKNTLSKDKKTKTLESPQFGERIYIGGIETGIFTIEAILRNDVIIVLERKPATLYMFMQTAADTWTIVQEWELRKGTRRSIIIRELAKQYAKKVPSLEDKCLVVFEGNIQPATVIKLDHRLAQFDVQFEFGELLSIPYSKFRPF